MTLRETWALLAPFVAALLASWLTFTFGVRSKRFDLAQAERLAGFRVFRERLLALKRYAEARAAEIDGGDYEPRLEELPAELQQSFLTYHNEITRIRDEYAYLFPVESSQALKPLFEHLGMVCSMELTRSSTDPSELEAAAHLYRLVAADVPSCLANLYSSLQLPK